MPIARLRTKKGSRFSAALRLEVFMDVDVNFDGRKNKKIVRPLGELFSKKS